MARGTTLLVVAVLIAGILMSTRSAQGSETETPVRLPVALAGDLEPPDAVRVRKGDNLWKISARHIEAHLRRSAETSEVSRYWRRVVAGNRESIRSGNPDLIYPGEVISLPPVVSEQP